MRRLGMVFLAVLFLFMVFAGPATQKADAVVVSTVVIGAVIAAMAAAGIGLAVSGMTSNQLQDWLSGKLNEWATSLGGSVQDHIDSNQITTTGRGFLSLGTLAANGISQFISWLKIQDNITDNTTTVAVKNADAMILQPGSYNKICHIGSYVSARYEGQGNVYVVVAYNPSNNRLGPLYIADFVFNYDLRYISDSNSYVPEDTAFQSGITISNYNSDATNNLIYVMPWYYYGGPENVSQSYAPVYDNVSTALAAVRDIIDSGVNGGSITYDAGVITIPTIDQTDKWFLDVGAEPGATVDTVTDGVIADTIDGSLTVSGEVAEEEPEFEVTGPIGVSGLTEVFPFCIPFDVYDLLSCLSAEPQTPVFTVRFVIPGVINQEFTIDLSPFSTIAQIVRTMELIAFAVGLALVTRERFLRS